MTPIVGFFLALVAGWIVREPRRAAAVVVLPYLAVTAVQTWSLANGYGVNPPSTVTPLSGAWSYWAVQAVFGLLALLIAAEVGYLRAPGRGGRAGLPQASVWYRAGVASAIGDTGVLVLLVAWLSQVKLVTHHTAGGQLPAQGVAGIALSLIGAVAFGIAALRAVSRERRARTAPGPLAAQPPAETGAR
jgi:TRAP-type C4-dicarboxylate transport system permease small subunit